MTTTGGSEAARGGTQLIVGPWRHASPLLGDPAGDFAFGIGSAGAALDMAGIQLRFFDRWVKGIPDANAADAPVKLYVMGTGVWRDEPAWPLARAVVTDHFLRSGGRANSLHGDGVLSLDAPPADELPDTFVSDPNDPVRTTGGNLCCHQVVLEPGQFDQREVEERDDVLVYSTAPLDRGRGGHRPGDAQRVRVQHGPRLRRHGQARGRLPRRPGAQPVRGHHPRPLPQRHRPRGAADARRGRGDRR